jgi:Fic family protein
MLNEDSAVKYHYGEFPPKNLKYDRILIEHLLSATDSLARYDQMLKGLHNSEILLAPMRDQEAIISSRIEGTFSTIDEILKYEADSKGEEGEFLATRDDVIETVLYRRALKSAQLAIEEGYPLSQSLIKGLHKQLLLFGRGASKSPGEYKKEQNYLADNAKKEILFVPFALSAR